MSCIIKNKRKTKQKQKQTNKKKQQYNFMVIMVILVFRATVFAKIKPAWLNFLCVSQLYNERISFGTFKYNLAKSEDCN